VSAFIRSDERIHGVAVVIPTNHREIPGSTPGRYNLQIEITSKSRKAMVWDSLLGPNWLVWVFKTKKRKKGHARGVQYWNHIIVHYAKISKFQHGTWLDPVQNPFKHCCFGLAWQLEQLPKASCSTQSCACALATSCPISFRSLNHSSTDRPLNVQATV